MHFHTHKVSATVLGLIAILTTGCQSTNRNPGENVRHPELDSLSACQKADSMWNDKIVPSRYDYLPPLTSPGAVDLFRLLFTGFADQALTGNGDELEQGRVKLIHAFGAEARLAMVIYPNEISRYTGIFQTGAECTIGRFSLATKPGRERSTPGLALKIFIAGDRPSVNLLLMNSVDGQVGHNYFDQTFTNILPAATSSVTRLLARAFERSAVAFGAKDTNPGRLTLEHLSRIQTNGQYVLKPQTPYQLSFRPTESARNLMRDATADDDFRVKLASLAPGQAIYDILVAAEGTAPEKAELLGQLRLVAPVISSRYGDEHLYFRHNMARYEAAPN